jgi:hypothetical protein
MTLETLEGAPRVIKRLGATRARVIIWRFPQCLVQDPRYLWVEGFGYDRSHIYRVGGLIVSFVACYATLGVLTV